MEIVKIENGRLSVSSGLDIDAFGRTNLVSLLNEEGICLKKNGSSFDISTFTFEKTEADGNSKICFTKAIDGDNFSTLSSILDSCVSSSGDNNEKDRCFYAEKLELAFEAIKKLTENSSLEKESEKKIFYNGEAGAGGIVIDKSCVLFLPPELFKTCAGLAGAKDSHEKYVNAGLKGRRSLLFVQSVASYRALTGEFPFKKDDISKRQEDITDSNFIPLNLYSDKISCSLSKSIEAGLSLQYEIIEKNSGRNFSGGNSKKAKLNAENEKLALDFNPEEFKENFLAQKKSFSRELEQSRLEYEKKLQAKISVKRFFRRNKTRLLAAGIAAVFALWLADGFIKENGRLITTRGLDSVQTTKALYTMIHRADVPNLQEIVKGKRTKDLVFKVAGFYVTSKQRLEQDAQDGTVAPAKWLFYKQNSTNWMYGITNLKINGISFDSDNDFPRKMDKPKAISEEDGTKLKKGDLKTCTAEYYFVNQDPNLINVEKISDEINLQWNGNRWIVKEVKGSSKNESVKVKNFSEEYFKLLTEGESIKSAVKILKNKYDWLPSDGDMKTAAEQLLEFSSTEAQKYLEEE